MHAVSRWLATVLAALVLVCPNAFAQSRSLTLGHVDLSFYEVTAKVVQSVLERMGYSVAVKTGSHAEIYPLLGKGEVDLFVAVWLPHAHASYWEQYKDSSIIVTTLFEDARLFWSVPDYVPATEVTSVADLRKPEVVARMQKEIRGTRPDSGLMIGSKKIMEEYALDASGYQLVPGKPADWIAAFDDNINAKRWFVMPLWQPQYLNRVARMRILDEPKQLLGGTDKAYLVAHKDFPAKVDKHAWKALQRMSLSVKAVTEMDYLVNVKKLTPEYAVRNWMAAHPDTVNYWLQPDPEE
jgi:glycine betaine/proline transport system substrate-binding protein